MAAAVAAAPASWLADVEASFEREAPAARSIARDSRHARHPGGVSLRFELRDGDVYRGIAGESQRAEMKSRRAAKAGETRWYGFSLCLAPGFPIEDNRLVLGQWWVKPRADAREMFLRPTLSQRYRKGVFKVTTASTKDTLIDRKNEPAQATLYADPAFPRGRWVDFVYEVKWSPVNGYVRVWRDGRLVVGHGPPVGYGGHEGPLFKFGLYRDPSPATAVAYFDEVRDGASFAEVDPSRGDGAAGGECGAAPRPARP